MTPSDISDLLHARFPKLEMIPFADVLTFVMELEHKMKAGIEAEMRKAMEKEKEKGGKLWNF